jgi:magnesium transporter
VSDVAVRWLDPSGNLAAGGLPDLSASREVAWRWVDVTTPDSATMQVLAEEFALHPLSVEDVLHVQVRPKLDLYPDGIFIAWLTPERPEGDGVISSELDMFLGAKYLITTHIEPVHAIDEVVSEIDRSMSRGPDWLLHSIIDRLVDITLPLVDDLGDELDDIEDDMLGEPRQGELNRLYEVRRQLVKMHRIVAPEREMLRELARERDIVSEEAYRYFQDVGDHLARVQDSIETYRDVGSGVMDIYLSAQNNRMNEIMKQLTVVATIFMPLTLISGVYGMNVTVGMWPSTVARWSFAAVVGTMVLIAVSMSIYFRKRNWW